MSGHEHPIWVLLDKLQMDAREHSAKLVELRSYVASLSLPDPKRRECPECGTAFRNELVMAEHRYNSHGGAVPEHYLAAERAAGLQDDPTPVPAAP